MLLGDLGREDGARQAAMGSRVRARSVGMDERRATALARSSEQWLQWLRRGLAARPDRGLAGLWDLLEEWFASDDFQTSGLAAAMAGLTGNGGEASRAVVAAHRRSLRKLLEEPAAKAGAGARAPISRATSSSTCSSLSDSTLNIRMSAFSASRIVARLPPFRKNCTRCSPRRRPRGAGQRPKGAA